jgi:NAD(P)-dependent dehydrogenase (short-subunit alcohol dehydrogenase family)
LNDFPAGAAIVIGGSGGIGRAICKEFIRQGSDVAFTYRSNKAAADGVISTLGNDRKVEATALDVADRPSVQKFVDYVAGQFVAIHTVVLAHGADISATYAADIDYGEWDRILASDLTGAFNVVKAALPHMRQRGGSFVAVSSAGLFRHPPKDVLSLIPKAGIEALMRAVAREEGRFGIRANSVAAGVIDVGLFHRLEGRLTPEFIEAMKRNTALRRFGTAQEVASMTIFLACQKSAFVTGQSIAVDGGYSV